MSFAFNVDELRLTDGTGVRPPADGMTVFIGPNNSGKSLLLRELATLVSTYPGTLQPVRWVAGVDVQNSGSAEEFLAWLHDQGNTPRAHPDHGQILYPSDNNSGMLQDQITAAWNGRGFSNIARYLIAQQWTQDRLGNQSDSQQWEFDFPPSHPTQYLFDNRDAQETFSQLVEEAFGKPIAINRYEQQIRLRVGRPGLPDAAPPASPELRAAYRALPVLNEQGDGFRSFVNILLHTLVRPKPVIVIDEPEAFLHPPQARLLGRYLAERTPSPCQVFVATHSADFVSGVLEASSKPVSLVRISRTADTPRARVLDPEAVTEILRTPVLRYSNIIAGLFHDGVVLGESEGDCQFYAATFDELRKDGPNDNLVFLHTSGKAKLADTARRLRQCGIPVAVVADLDLLNDRGLLRPSLSLLGGALGDIESDLKILEEQVGSTVTVLSAQEIKKKINGILGNPKSGAALTADQSKHIAELLRSSGGWKQLKKSGLHALTGSDAYAAVQRLVAYFGKLGVFLVPVGELEGWVPQVPSGNKSRWLTRVFDEGHYRSPRSELVDFCAQVGAYLASDQ
ncbi:ATP-dependent nuclease [Kitasatospora sp. DSM 101779]|uniref:ATP-dependent nuclease n=1 Tax=Kitasatospora sp. DSM 101779 TaxID=2853165 RepID=UPI0021DB240B|nr:AAA family ATPase [Kitasatospora sp. DSM 101779]MCU7827291.1 AAA family ATPase [Kitasatospora sp. DSM 101779]